jgi:suppressor of fused
MTDEDELEAAGWDTITAAFEKLYGPGEPAGHWGTVMPWALGGPDPLDGVSAYASDSGRPHWHYVTFGLTELFQKESEEAEVSGFGFELSFRLARSSDETAPPLWPVSLLQNLARYVFKSGNVFAPGHHMNANGPICLGSPTKLRALLFASDPALPPLTSPNGRFEFVHVVGATLDELDAIQLWDTLAFLDLVRGDGPALISDLARPSYLESPAFAARVREASQRDGSSCGSLYNPRFGFEQDASGTPLLSLGAKEVGLVAQLLPLRLRHQQSLDIVGSKGVVTFMPGAQRAQRREGDAWIIELPPEAAAEIGATLEPRAGRYQAGGLTWLIEKSIVTDEAGNVIEELG